MADKFVKLSDAKRKVNYILTRNGSSPQTRRNVSDALGKLPYTVKAELESTLEAADVQPVKRGRWKIGEAWWQSKCTLCNAQFGVIREHAEKKYHFCPNCGARMEGGADDENV